MTLFERWYITIALIGLSFQFCSLTVEIKELIRTNNAQTQMINHSSIKTEFDK